MNSQHPKWLLPPAMWKAFARDLACFLVPVCTALAAAFLSLQP